MILASFKAKVLPRLGLEASTEGTHPEANPSVVT